MRIKLLAALLFTALPGAVMAQNLADDQVPLAYAQSLKPHTARVGAAGSSGVLGKKSNGGVLGIDTVANWSSYFYLPGAVPSGGSYYPQYTWPYGMVGNSPLSKGGDDHGDDDWKGNTTWIGAPIVPVIIDLRNYDGSPRFINGKRAILDPTPYLDPLLKSPVFSNTSYDSSD